MLTIEDSMTLNRNNRLIKLHVLTMFILQDTNRATGNPVKKPNSQYFCTHCKILGHCLERCFKINGYPPGFKDFKDKRIAAVSYQSQPDTSNNTDGNLSISVDQYTKLMEMLNKQQIQDASNDSSPHALLAGNFCLMTSSNTSWILDSGSANLELFDTYK